ncbi:hypothetical protein EUX98_g4482 [Antrodiella citrinella]|uniref:Protein kinase domain-containing protein n=1 Tax=Antrodiella citrinella TaxID=2447956 RepID=A0A4S4MTZ5_9APHY|nr:hypothetical protein EUX98_g4482 [Antrodiella citrinella]
MDDLKAYGRAFEGCGARDDYDIITKLGEGTFGEVHKARHREKNTMVALKRILMHNEKEGMPVTALREIKILKALHHPCIVDIVDMFVVKSRIKESPLSVYMVFPYMDHDLAGLLENERVKLSPSQIKLYMKQLLEGTDYMHRNHILHRDMKAANLLISNTGCLKIADFGLARAYDPNVVKSGDDLRGRERKYTNCVVTRWYRPPELLLGARQYGGEVDMWGIGCVLGEMFWRKPILPGTSDLDQLEKIWKLCGTPNQHTWPNFDLLPGCEGIKRFTLYPRRLKQQYETIGAETIDLMDKLLTCNPRERLTASQALDHDYFWTDPLPADPKTSRSTSLYRLDRNTFLPVLAEVEVQAEGVISGIVDEVSAVVASTMIFLTGATAVAITTIGRDLHFKQAELQWPINIYTLSYGCLLLLLGRIADITGTKKMFLIGSAWFTVWSVATAFAPNAWTFILFFAFQGMGSAANTPAGIAIISSYFPPGKAKNRAFSILGAGQPIGYIVGLILGGILSQSPATWRAIYGLQAGLGLVLCVLGWLILPTDQAEKRYNKGLDWVGAILSIGGLGLMVYDLG